MARNLCLLILLASTSFAYENYWFSYKITTENNIITNEERNISPIMVNEEFTKKFLCQIDDKKTRSETTQNFLYKNYDNLLNCFYKVNSKVHSYGQIELKGSLNENDVRILPIKFTVEFNSNFANIYLLKNK